MKPYPFQRECIQEVRKFKGRSLLALDMGLGKTLISLWCLTKAKDCLPVVVVCPASVKYQWAEEASRVNPDWRLFICEGFSASMIPSRTDFIFTSYDILNQTELPGTILKVKGRTVRTNQGKIKIIGKSIKFKGKYIRSKPIKIKPWIKEIERLQPETLIIDECQSISNYTKRTRACQRLAKEVRYLLALSGTPLLNRPIELYNTLRLIRPKLFPSRLEYATRYCDPERTPWGWQYKGAMRLDELHGILEDNLMVRRRKEEVLKDLPELKRQVITVPMSDPLEYQRANTDFIKWLKNISPEKAMRAKRASSMSKIGYLLRLAAQLKLPYMVEWINQFLEGTDEKLVVFATHKKIIKGLAKASKNSVIIDGSTPPKERRSIVKRFQQDESLRLMVGNIQAAGTGLDGLQVAHNAMFAELPWQPGQVSQAESRLHRIGARKDIWIRFLVARDSIEVRLLKLLQQKQKILSQVLDGGSQESDFDVFDKLMFQLKG